MGYIGYQLKFEFVLVKKKSSKFLRKAFLLIYIDTQGNIMVQIPKDLKLTTKLLSCQNNFFRFPYMRIQFVFFKCTYMV